MTKLQKISLGTVLLMATAAACAPINNPLEPEEAESRMYQATFDTDGSGGLDKDEFNNALHATWDQDQDRRLDQNELEAGFTSWDPDLDANFVQFDDDADGFVSQDEFRTGLADANTEANAVTFENFDGNGDGQVDQDEFTRGLGG